MSFPSPFVVVSQFAIEMEIKNEMREEILILKHEKFQITALQSKRRKRERKRKREREITNLSVI
jgi:hypothetical protein